MFDRVHVKCPACSEEIEFQSKAGPCHLTDFGLDNAPLEVLADIKGNKEAQTCKCGARVRVVVSFRAWPELVGHGNDGVDRVEGREEE